MRPRHRKGLILLGTLLAAACGSGYQDPDESFPSEPESTIQSMRTWTLRYLNGITDEESYRDFMSLHTDLLWLDIEIGNLDLFMDEVMAADEMEASGPASMVRKYVILAAFVGIRTGSEEQYREILDRLIDAIVEVQPPIPERLEGLGSFSRSSGEASGSRHAGRQTR